MIPVLKFLRSIPITLEALLPEILAGRRVREQKADGSYVTRGDYLVQETILDLLREHLPTATVISEELAFAESAETPGGSVVVIDPIDGTENFTSGLPEWGTSISVYHDGVHSGSLIGCPQMSIWLQTGQVMERFESRIRGLSSSLSKEDLIDATQGYEYRILGCCVYNMINVIRGAYHSFENPKGAHSWDILAGLNLAREQNLKITVEGEEYAGEYLAPTRKYRFKVEQQ